MKHTTSAVIGGLALLHSSLAPTLAVEGQALQVQGTNLVLSWPSPGGYQEYLIQYRQTLAPSTPWTQLTNNYFANSTNRTTYTILGAVPPAAPGGGGGGSNTTPPAPMSAAIAEPTQPMVTRADGTGPILPLAIYPRGLDMSRFLIYDPAISNWVSGSEYKRPAPSLSTLRATQPQDSPELDGPGDNDPPSTGFYRVFHIPDWDFEITNYTYDTTWFLPVDFADYRDYVDNIQVLINGEPSPHAEFMPYDMGGGQTNWGMGFHFDRLTNGTYQIQLVTTLRLNDEIGDNSVFLVLSNLTRSIVVFNQAMFPDWNAFIQGDTYTFKAQLANPDTDW